MTETKAEALERAIRDAMKWANGRWGEWGDRALSVCEILEAALECREPLFDDGSPMFPKQGEE